MSIAMRSSVTRRRIVALLVATGIPVALAQAGGADTANPPTVTKATVEGVPPPQVDVAPPGPLTGLGAGSSVTITVSAKPGNEGKVFGFQVRLCKTGVDIKNQASFNPTQFGNCIDQPFSAQTDDFIEVSAAPTNTTASATFRVGEGTRAFSTSLNGDTTITCGPGNPCTLWLKESVDTAVLSTGTAWIHYDLQFTGADTSSTTTSSSTSSSSTSSSSTSSTSSTTTTLPPSSTTSSTSTSSTSTSSTSTSSTSTSSTSTSSTSTVPSSSTSSSSTSSTTAVPPSSTSSTSSSSTSTTVPPSSSTTSPSTSTTIAVPPSTTSSTSTTIGRPSGLQALICTLVSRLLGFLERFIPGLATQILTAFGCAA